ncbi:hypothetical protein [Nonomuraea sp. NPDC049400]|uniref:hypothetical protein n=1 Tax=Nonomuraea sp. NPDC049400 TaxID=3364352 RepID=UPI003791962C
MKDFIDRRRDELAHLQISWFDGEPMLAQSVIGEVASRRLRGVGRVPGRAVAAARL